MCGVLICSSGPVKPVCNTVNITVADYYLNDSMGRELFHHLDKKNNMLPMQLLNVSSNLCITRLLTLNENDVHPIERAIRDIICDIYANSPPLWFRKFADFFIDHIDMTYRDNTFAARQCIRSVQEYIEDRRQLSGMAYTISLFEYTNECYLDIDSECHIKKQI